MTGQVVARARQAVGVHGLRGVTRLAVRQGLSALRGRPEHVDPKTDGFDDERDVDTEGIVRLHELRIDSPNRRFGTRYEASDTEGVRAMLAALDDIVGPEFTFVDLGSGKGRVVLLAREHTYKHVIGVEFSPELAAIARANLARTDDISSAEIMCADVTEFALPTGPTIFYNYNAFAEPVLRRVLANIRASVDADPRPILFLIVSRKVDESVFHDAGFVRGPDVPFAEVWTAS